MGLISEARDRSVEAQGYYQQALALKNDYDSAKIQPRDNLSQREALPPSPAPLEGCRRKESPYDQCPREYGKMPDWTRTGRGSVCVLPAGPCVWKQTIPRPCLRPPGTGREKEKRARRSNSVWMP